ncbi:secreted frizzled-related protein 3 [Gadus morhua]|uniref:secreted frizzled-related protein 3 n=1 Tax=Gadus morhua TaxID=8049 RepID=UPI0011B5B138|nr:secreted frizzled-related protein 3 [Gadus morhua]XP_056435228.1 secreted frizzled-related protein 3 isoform X1 [Gadus chalcogrammus]
MTSHALPMLLAFACLLRMPSRASAATCEPVRIPLCGSMPWNMTKMPNHLHHSTQANAVLAIEQFEGLLGTGCSPDLLFLLCAMYAPICTIDFQHEPIKPCKAVCERAKSGCEPVMKLYNHSWPESLSCSELPLYDRGVCISPEAIVKAEGPDPYYQDPARCAPELSPDFPNNLHCKGPNEDRCTCKTVRLSLKTYLKNNYNYVIRARVKEVRTRGQELTATVEVKEVFKSSLVNIPRETNTLFYISSCPCPPLSPGVDYIILGYENKETSRLLLIEGSVAQKWKDRIGRKVKRWDQVLQERTSGRAAQRGVHH